MELLFDPQIQILCKKTLQIASFDIKYNED
jgi:hypothetical protein